MKIIWLAFLLSGCRSTSVPSIPMEQEQTLWWAMLADRNYYSKPYIHQGTVAPPEERYVNNMTIRIERPNHSIAHAIRQGLEVKDIINVLLSVDFKTLTPQGQKLATYVRQSMGKDPNFKEKVEMISIYYRSGRESEVSPSSNLKGYRKSGYASANNFFQAAKDYPRLFNDDAEIQKFHASMLSEYVHPEYRSDPNSEMYFLYQLSHAAHMLDLVRLRKVAQFKWKVDDIDTYFENELATIVGFKSKHDPCVKTLIRRGYSYVHITGDQRYKGKWYTDEFFRLHADLRQMVEKLYAIYDKPFSC